MLTDTAIVKPMADVPQMTTYRRVRFAVQNNLNEILLAGETNSLLINASSFHCAVDGTVTLPASLSNPVAGLSCRTLSALEFLYADVSTDDALIQVLTALQVIAGLALTVLLRSRALHEAANLLKESKQMHSRSKKGCRFGA